MSKIIATLPFEKDIQELEAVLDRLQSQVRRLRGHQR